MSLLDIPFRGSSALPSGRQRVTLDGVTLGIVFDWNGREGRWYVSIFTASGAPIVTGRKLVADWSPTKRVRSESMPGGRLVVVDTSESGTDPGLDGFADRVVLMYADEAEVAALEEG